MNKDHEEIRKELWCNVWVAVAGASNSTKSELVSLWADRALRDFDERFPAQKEADHETP
jgi:hypothetical protein